MTGSSSSLDPLRLLRWTEGEANWIVFWDKGHLQMEKCWSWKCSVVVFIWWGGRCLLSLKPLCRAKMLIHFVKKKSKAKYIIMETIPPFPPTPHPSSKLCIYQLRGFCCKVTLSQASKDAYSLLPSLFYFVYLGQFSKGSLLVDY